MNIERLLMGFGRRVLTRLAFRGIDRVAGGPEENRTPEDKARARQAKQMAKRAKQAQRVTRRMMRMR